MYLVTLYLPQLYMSMSNLFLPQLDLYTLFLPTKLLLTMQRERLLQTPSSSPAGYRVIKWN